MHHILLCLQDPHHLVRVRVRARARARARVRVRARVRFEAAEDGARLLPESEEALRAGEVMDHRPIAHAAVRLRIPLALQPAPLRHVPGQGRYSGDIVEI